MAGAIPLSITAPTLVDAKGQSTGVVQGSLSTDYSLAGYVSLASELAEDTDTTGRITEPLRTSTQGRLPVGQSIPLLNEQFAYTPNTGVFRVDLTTYQIAITNNALILNSSNTDTTNALARIATYSYFPLLADMALYSTWDFAITTLPQLGHTVEMGFVYSTSTTAAATDGAFFRLDLDCQFMAVLNTGGAERTVLLTTPSIGVMHGFKIVIENDRALYYVDGVCVAVIATLDTTGLPFWSNSLPWVIRMFTVGTNPAQPQTVRLSYVFVGLQDSGGLGKNMGSSQLISGKQSSAGQSGQTVGSTATYSNNLAGGAGAILDNTTSRIPGLGGQTSILGTAAIGTDGSICSFQNPAGSATLPARNLYITGAQIFGAVTVVLAGGPLLMAYSLCYGHTAITLVTAENATAGTKAPRRIPLGYETYALNAPVGTLGGTAPVRMDFSSPICILPGQYVSIVGKNLGTVTTTGVVVYNCEIYGYWE